MVAEVLYFHHHDAQIIIEMYQKHIYTLHSDMGKVFTKQRTCWMVVLVLLAQIVKLVVLQVVVEKLKL